MAGVESRSVDSPDETRSPDKTRVDVVRMGSTTAGRFAFEPGWRWADCIKPVAGTESCRARHVGVVRSGRLAVSHDHGTEVELGPGDAYVIEPGHDAWVVGDEGLSGSSSRRERRRSTRRASYLCCEQYRASRFGAEKGQSGGGPAAA